MDKTNCNIQEDEARAEIVKSANVSMISIFWT